jgi:phosphoribosylformimino-5-aminoimidazole carboxamide ribotide isomerase
MCEVEFEGVEGIISGRAIYSGDLEFEAALACAKDLNG